jgi:hypothetical protein
VKEIVVEVSSRFAAITAQMIVAIDRALERNAYSILARSQIKMATGAKTGRIYKRGSVLHQASAPGEAPAVDTGALLNSGFVKRQGIADFGIGFSAEYAWILEEYKDRPFVAPSLAEQEPLLLDDVAEAMRR